MERRSGISIIKEQDQEKQKLRLASQLSRRSAAILELAKISQPKISLLPFSFAKFSFFLIMMDHFQLIELLRLAQ